MTMKTVGTAELKAHLGKYLKMVQAGESVEVTSHRHPIAELRPSAAGVETTIISPTRPMSDLKILMLSNCLDGSISDTERVALHSHFRILWEAAHQISLTAPILARAADPFPTVVGTLDAIHLSSALAITSSGVVPTMLTHDQQLARAASSVGLDVSGV
jgi:prevent-host-death family protein